MGRIPAAVRALPLSPAASCPYCREPLQGPAVRCCDCGTSHHDTCWNDNGSRCTVFQCQGNQTLGFAFPPALLLIAEILLLAAAPLLFLYALH